ncbi:bile salt export pump [Gracilaria domingensis]|nr:bile salt export pump [Gracilaria domingensis]
MLDCLNISNSGAELSNSEAVVPGSILSHECGEVTRANSTSNSARDLDLNEGHEIGGDGSGQTEKQGVQRNALNARGNLDRVEVGGLYDVGGTTLLQVGVVQGGKVCDGASEKHGQKREAYAIHGCENGGKQQKKLLGEQGGTTDEAREHKGGCTLLRTFPFERRAVHCARLRRRGTLGGPPGGGTAAQGKYVAAGEEAGGGGWRARDRLARRRESRAVKGSGEVAEGEVVGAA